MTTLTAHTVELGTSDHLGVLATITPPAKEEPVKFVPYSQWSTRPRGTSRDSHPIGATRGITAHWEGPHMGAFPHSSCAGKVRQIQDFHRDTRGWADIAYNGVVCPHGYVFEGRGAGVKSAANGNTTANDTHYALCYLGGQGDPFTAEGKRAFLDGFAWLAREGAAGPERNGHRDHKATACPGDAIYAWVHSLDGTPPSPREEFSMDAEAKEAFEKLDSDNDATYAAVVSTRSKVDWVANQLKALVDPDALADKIAARIDADDVSADVVKQAVKDALREGVEA